MFRHSDASDSFLSGSAVLPGADGDSVPERFENVQIAQHFTSALAQNRNGRIICIEKFEHCARCRAAVRAVAIHIADERQKYLLAINGFL